MKRNIKCKLVFCFLLLFLFLGANFVSALEIDYPRIPGVKPPQDFVKTASSEDILSLYIKYLFNLVIWAAGIIALGVLIYGGIRYLLSTGKPEAMVSAKDQITAAFFGLLLLFSSYLVLSILSPQFVVLEILELKPIEIPKRPEVEPQPIETVRTSINVEMPFGRIIETIFETYFWQLPDTITWEPRMTRVKNSAETTKKLADKLKKQSEDLYNDSYDCTCRQTDPEEPCGGNKSGDTTWKCDCGGCDATEPCTCDPCEKVRGDIQNAEQKNLENIYLGTEITETNAAGEEYTITTSLTKEIEKTDTEIKDLRKELNRLKEAERFIESCPWDVLNSLARFLIMKDYFIKQEYSLLETMFWDDVNIIYISKWTGKPISDWATFYCSVGGTLEEFPYPSLTPSQSQLTGEETTEEVETFGQMACSSEAPVGEIIDRTKKTTQLLIDKMEMLVEKDKELIDAVDELQVLVGQCSSKRGCERRCTCFRCGCGSDPCIDRCQGWIYCCADSSGPYPSECKDRDEDTPCPYSEIDNQLEEIKNIWQEITDLIEGKGDNETPEETGIIPIIDEVVPEILRDLEVEIKYPMGICTSKEFKETDVILLNCVEAKGGIDPKGEIIRECCQGWNKEEGKQTEFGDCLEECYLEKGQEKYRKCLKKCLDQKSIKELSWCRDRLNFFCCHAKQ